jgi:hypothetical protein
MKFYFRLSILTIVACLIASSILAFESGPQLWASLMSLCLVSAGTAASFPLLERKLQSGNLVFLQRYFMGMLLRVCLLTIGGVLVWKGTSWSLKYYLISAGLSYPLFVIFEAWTLSKMLCRKKGAVSASTGKRTDDKESAACF